MAFKSFPVAIGSTDTDVFECPAATEAAVVLLVSNVSSSARTYTLKFYKASLDVTRTLLSSVSVAANTAAKVPAPISMEAGDKIIMSCSNANDIVAGGTITMSGTVQVISTFVSEGEWNSETTYTANVSIVSRSGNSYLARPNEEANVDQDPATATDFWMLLAEKGETGDGDLSAAQNLNDLADKPTAFNNIKQAATDESSGVVELATSAEVAAAAENKVLTAGHLETAAESVALTDASTVAVDWTAAVNFTLTVTDDREIGNPTNGIPGTSRTILVQGDDSTDREITFDTEFLGDVPTITDCDDGTWYLLTIFCIAVDHFVVSKKRAKG